MKIKIKKIENGKLPEYKTIGAVGADCFARISKTINLWENQRVTIPLGFAVEIPAGYEMQVRGRSGLAKNNGVDCFIGTIDSDYRGEVCAILVNKSKELFQVKPFDRIAQIVIAPVIKAEWEENETLSETKRGVNGFGSTGVEKNEDYYIPFTFNDDVEKLLGQKVVFDNCIEATILNVFCVNTYAKQKFVKIKIDDENYNGNKVIDFPLVTAFERLKINGHRFGKKIEI